MVGIFCCFRMWGQIGMAGINTSTPSAILDIVSKGNTSTTKAFNILNSDNIKLLEVLDDGNVGINLGTSSPGNILHVKTDIRHENLPVLSLPYSPMTLDNSGISKLKAVTKYFYYKRLANFGNFTLSSSATYTNIPFFNGADVLGNTAGFGFGTDVAATVNGQAAGNVSYILIPEPGVYLFEMYQTAFCSGSPTATTNTGQISLNTVFATAGTGNTSYTTSTIFRDYMVARRFASGSTHANSYAYANPQKLVVAYESTSLNEKVALFINYVGGDSYSTQSCFMNKPNNSDNFGYLIVTKL